jgi:hypothetical protein
MGFKIKTKGAFLTIILVVVFSSIVYARTIKVPSRDASTISKAMIVARAGDTVLVRQGVYKERVMISYGVTLRARQPYASVIDGKGRGKVVTMGQNTTLEGFEIRNGTVGVYSENVGNTIRHCIITENWQSGIVCSQLLPRIEDNVIAFNHASGVVISKVQGGMGPLNHNTIIHNWANGIVTYKTDNIMVENNIIANNKRYGMKIGKGGKNLVVKSNNFYGNKVTNNSLAKDNVSFLPAFIGWKDGRFMLDLTCVDVNDLGEDGMGVRFVE